MRVWLTTGGCLKLLTPIILAAASGKIVSSDPESTSARENRRLPDGPLIRIGTYGRKRMAAPLGERASGPPNKGAG